MEGRVRNLRILFSLVGPGKLSFQTRKSLSDLWVPGIQRVYEKLPVSACILFTNWKRPKPHSHNAAFLLIKHVHILLQPVINKETLSDTFHPPLVSIE